MREEDDRGRKPELICPVLFKKMLSMGSMDFVKQYRGFLCPIIKPQPGGPSPK